MSYQSNRLGALSGKKKKSYPVIQLPIQPVVSTPEGEPQVPGAPAPTAPVATDNPLDAIKNIPPLYLIIGAVAIFFLMGKR